MRLSFFGDSAKKEAKKKEEEEEAARQETERKTAEESAQKKKEAEAKEQQRKRSLSKETQEQMEKVRKRLSEQLDDSIAIAAAAAADGDVSERPAIRERRPSEELVAGVPMRRSRVNRHGSASAGGWVGGNETDAINAKIREKAEKRRSDELEAAAKAALLAAEKAQGTGFTADDDDSFTKGPEKRQVTTAQTAHARAAAATAGGVFLTASEHSRLQAKMNLLIKQVAELEEKNRGLEKDLSIYSEMQGSEGGVASRILQAGAAGAGSVVRKVRRLSIGAGMVKGSSPAGARNSSPQSGKERRGSFSFTKARRNSFTQQQQMSQEEAAAKATQLINQESAEKSPQARRRRFSFTGGGAKKGGSPKVPRPPGHQPGAPLDESNALLA